MMSGRRQRNERPARAVGAASSAGTLRNRAQGATRHQSALPGAQAFAAGQAELARRFGNLHRGETLARFERGGKLLARRDPAHIEPDRADAVGQASALTPQGPATTPR